MDRLEQIGKAVLEHFHKNRRLLSFDEYLLLVEEDPRRHARSAAQYLRDVFDHYGTRPVRSPEGEVRRFQLFDAPWDEGEGKLIGQEKAQNELYRIISNFSRQRRVDRFVLLHGPNGSSKSTITEMLARAMEHYSSLDQGVMYRFNWIFPTQAVSRGSGIGFGGKKAAEVTGAPPKSYAHLEDAEVDARLICELRDHPLLLIPRRIRVKFLEEQLAAHGVGDEFLLSDYLLAGDLCTKCKLIYESLLNSYQGDYLRVLQHVQVERCYVSRRYREASARVEPQLAVDAKTRQVTADRSLSALPTALQSINLFEPDGDLVQANRGVIDYSDLLKRPLEAFKYLLTTVEDGRVTLDDKNLFLDLIFVGSSNDAHLNAFMESPEWMSFKGRLELVRVPYLREYPAEREIYAMQVSQAQVGKHVAPHALATASLWGVLTRMHRPEPEAHEEPLRGLVSKLTPIQKVELYAQGQVPEEVRGEEAKTLRAGIAKIWSETDSDVVYEGRTGASPREIKTVVLNAAQNPMHACLSANAVLEELGELCQEVSFYPYLRMEPKEGYYDHKGFIETARDWFLDRVDADVRVASGLVTEASYAELFSRYVTHVIHFVRKERMRNSVTGAMDDPDEKLMQEVEKELGAEGTRSDYRQHLISKIGAWSVDHSGEKPDYPAIFPEHFSRLRKSYFDQHSRQVGKLLRDTVKLLTDGDGGLPVEAVRDARALLERMESDRGYCEECAREALVLLLRLRYAS
jgi:predicted Ser/Thr protein kinase